MSTEPLSMGQVQAALESAGRAWRAEPNPLWELAPAAKARRLGYVPGPTEPPLDQRVQIARANVARAESAAGTRRGFAAPPAKYDLRDVGGKNFCGPLKDQGNCGSCVAFGTLAAVEGTLRVQAGDPDLAADLSEAHLFYCHARSQGRNCGNGWWVPPALDSVKAPGVAREADFPYTAGDRSCGVAGGWESRAAKVAAWHSVADPVAMKEWLSTRGPMPACFVVYEDFYAYASGVYRHSAGQVLGGHCVCCVGYDDDARCWICKNSWGPGWGEGGYFRIGYGECGIDAEMWAVERVTVAGGDDDDDDTTGEWVKNVHVTGLWATATQERNACAYIEGNGWRRVAPDADPIFLNLLVQLTAAKAAGRPVNVRQAGGVIKEVYVL